MIPDVLKNKILPSINALLIVGMVVYFYGEEISSNTLLLIGVVLAITQDAIIKWFTETVSLKEHLIVFFTISIVWIAILFNNYFKPEIVNEYEGN